jgi:hypothetical protein
MTAVKKCEVGHTYADCLGNPLCDSALFDVNQEMSDTEKVSMSVSRFLLASLIALFATACGGGGGGSLGFDTGIGGSGGGTGMSGRVVGPFQGAGSIIVNDRTLTTGAAEFEIEDGSGESDLEEGQRLVVFSDLSSNEAERVVYRSDVKGPVTSITIVDPLTASSEIVVLGQTIITNSVTRFDGVALDTLVVGDVLEVSGSPNADGTLVATFVELKAALAEYKAVGMIENLDAAAMTFDLDSLAVDYSSATLSEFSGADVADGQRVEVKVAAADFTPPSSALASEVELLSTVAFEEGEEVEYEGFIDRFVSATNFDVEGLRVATDGATEFVGGDAGSLGLNVKVEAEGTINANGVLVAERIIIKPTGAVRVEGTVSSVDETARTVSTDVGLTFEIRALTELEDDRDGVDPFDLPDLQIGDYVEVRGFLDGQALVAAELERDEFDSRTRMRGPVTAEDEAAGTVDILGVTVTGVAGVTDYDDTQAQFHADVEEGTFVEAEWDPFNSSTDTAHSLSIED